MEKSCPLTPSIMSSVGHLVEQDMWPEVDGCFIGWKPLRMLGQLPSVLADIFNSTVQKERQVDL